MKKAFQLDENGFYGEFGGAYVPEELRVAVETLQHEYLKVIESEEFKKEYIQLLRDYVGRPSPLYYARRMSEKYGCQLYLKREDLNHTGHRTDIVGKEDGQDTHNRRDGSRTTWSGDRYGMCIDEHALRGVSGCC